MIDTHAHIYPSGIAQKATAGVARFYDMEALAMCHVGTSDELIKSGARIGVTAYWVCSVATSPRQVSSINRFIAGECAAHPEFIGLGTLHPDTDDLEADVAQIIELGLRGIKIHPDFQQFRLDEPKAMRLFEIIEGRLPILIHTGDRRFDFSNPQRMLRVIKHFPQLTAIGAHFGGWSVWHEAVRVLSDTDLYVDTSSTTGFVTSGDELRTIASAWNPERTLFGVDFPMWDHTEEFARFEKFGYSAQDVENVLYKNAQRIMGDTPLSL